MSDKSACGATEFATERGMPLLRYPDPNQGSDRGLSLLLSTLEDGRVDAILLAGYLKFVPPEVLRAFPNAVLNIHPALLPAFGGKGCYGSKVHELVLESCARFSGPTVHFVNEKYDDGKIIAQAVVAVQPEDTVATLSKRVLQREHELYPAVVAAWCDGRIGWTDQGKPFVWSRA